MPTINVPSGQATRIQAAVFDPGQRVVRNRGAAVLYVGPDDTVSAATGSQVAAGGEEEFELQTGEELWAFQNSGAGLAVDVD